MDTLFTAILLQVLVLCTEASTSSPCPDDILRRATIDCMETNGFSIEFLDDYLPVASELLGVDATHYQMICDQKIAYYKAIQCVLDANTRYQCSQTEPNNQVNRNAQMVNMICDDPNFKFDCITELIHLKTSLKDCVATRYGQNSTDSEMITLCEHHKLEVLCAQDLMKSCDQHTADVFASAQEIKFLDFCGVIVG